MNIWIIQTGEPHQNIDNKVRKYRIAQLIDHIKGKVDNITWWTSTFNHAKKQFRFSKNTRIYLSTNVLAVYLHGLFKYKTNSSIVRLINHHFVALNFFLKGMYYNKPNVILASIPTLELCFVACIICKLRRINFIVDVRDLWPDVFKLNKNKVNYVAFKLLYSYYSLLKNIVLVNADHIITVSPSYSHWVYETTSNKNNITTIPISYEKNKNTENINSCYNKSRNKYEQNCTIRMIFAGTLGQSYDLSKVISAIRKRNTPKKRRIILYICGVGDNYEKYSKLISNNNDIKLLGWLGSKKLVRIINICHFGITGYKEKSFQSLPNKPFEYLAHGLIIINTLPGDLEKLLDEHKVGKTIFNTEASYTQLLDEISTLNKENIKELKSRSINVFNENYDSTEICEKYFNIIKNHVRNTI